VELFLPSGRDIATQLCEEGLACWRTTDINFADDDVAEFENFGPVMVIEKDDNHIVAETKLPELEAECNVASDVMINTSSSSVANTDYDKFTSSRTVLCIHCSFTVTVLCSRASVLSGINSAIA